jgi:uncharacterized membrane protein
MYIEQKIITLSPLRTAQTSYQKTRQNFVFRSRDFVYCRPSSPFVYFAVYFVALHRALSLAIVVILWNCYQSIYMVFIDYFTNFNNYRIEYN